MSSVEKLALSCDRNYAVSSSILTGVSHKQLSRFFDGMRQEIPLIMAFNGKAEKDTLPDPVFALVFPWSCVSQDIKTQIVEQHSRREEVRFWKDFQAFFKREQRLIFDDGFVLFSSNNLKEANIAAVSPRKLSSIFDWKPERDRVVSILNRVNPAYNKGKRIEFEEKFLREDEGQYYLSNSYD